MASRPDFRNTALLSGLVSKLQLEEAERALREDGSGDRDGPAILLAADDQLAAKLVDLGVITPYQSAQLQAGRTKLNLGPYQVTDYIDKGGMGQVYKAEHDVMAVWSPSKFYHWTRRRQRRLRISAARCALKPSWTTHTWSPRSTRVATDEFIIW